MKTRWVLALVCLSAASAASLTAVAGTPLTKMPLFRHVEADPNKEYPLTEKEGPWMIMAMTFSGEQAETEAKELVYELRKDFKLPAYIHKVAFDYDKPVASAAVDSNGQPKKLRYQFKHNHEIAVLVGNYPLVDDPEAQSVLAKLKAAQPQCLDLERRKLEGKSDSRTLGALRYMQDRARAAIREQLKRTDAATRGPMRHAFITTNPLVPEEYFVPKGVESEVAQFNEKLPYGLLKCPGKYTVRVATFNGSVVIDQKTIAKIQSGGEFTSQLAEAAYKAHKLVEALRIKGYEAYEFHDRTSSIVTVGSFPSAGELRPDGTLEPNPQIVKVVNTFGAQKIERPGQPAEIKCQVLATIPFDVQPLPIEVPRPALSADYDSTRVSQR